MPAGSVADKTTMASTLSKPRSQDASSAAVLAVLETYELLEEILAYVATDPRQIIRIQRVSRCWKALILRSAKLDRTLLLKVQAPDSQMGFLVRKHGLEGHEEYRIHDRLPTRTLIGMPCTQEGIVNQLLCLPPLGMSQIWTPTLEYQLNFGLRLPLTRAATDALRYPGVFNSSCGRMYLTNPPIMQIEATVVTQNGRAVVHAINNTSGIQLQDLHAMVANDLQLRRDPTLSIIISILPSPSGYSPIVFPTFEEPRLAHLFPRSDKVQQGPAIDRVNATFELVEAILGLLLPQTAIASQRVCKRWREVFCASSSIQRDAFLELELGDAKTISPPREDPHHERQPPMIGNYARFQYYMVVREQKKPRYFGPMMPWIKRSTRFAHGFGKQLGRVNSLLCDTILQHGTTHRFKATVGEGVTIALRKEVLQACATFAEDSRNRMFLIQPARRQVRVHFEGVLGDRYFWVFRSGGVRLCDILEEAERYPVDLTSLTRMIILEPGDDLAEV